MSGVCARTVAREGKVVAAFESPAAMAVAVLQEALAAAAGLRAEEGIFGQLRSPSVSGF